MTATVKKTGTRRRQVVAGQRRNQLRVTLADEELAAFRAAAAAAGLATAAWLARAGMDQASGLSVPASAALRKAVEDLAAAGRQARTIGYALNRVVIALEAGGAPGDGPARAVRLSEQALARIDAATIAVTEALP